MTGESFGFALARMKIGLRFRRAGWPAKTWIAVSRNDTATVRFGEEEHTVPIAPFIVMYTSAGRLLPFTPTQTDLLAEDWEVASGEEA